MARSSRSIRPPRPKRRLALDAFEESEWGRKFAAIAPLWQRQWDQVIPFFAFPPEVRRIIYTTNAIESMHMQLRKFVKTAAISPPTKRRASCCIWSCAGWSKNWKNAQREWTAAMTQFAIMFGDRFSVE